MAEDTGGLGGLLGFVGRGYDPAAAYGGLLTEQPTRDAMLARSLAAMAGAFGQGAMPSPYKGGTPFLATLGQAAQAAYGGQDELIRARTQAAQAALYGAQGAIQQSNLDINKAMLPGLKALVDRGLLGAGTDETKLTGPAALLKAGGLDHGQTYWTPEGLAALRPTEGKYDQIHYPSGDPSTASGAYGFLDRTWKQQAPLAGVDITKYPRAYLAPPEVQDAVAAITPIHHWTGVDANGKPFNAAAQKLATNPAFVTGPAASATPAGTSTPPAGMPRSLLADQMFQVPHYTNFGATAAAEPPPAVSAAAPRPAQPPGVSLNSRGQLISQDLSRDLPGQRIGSAAVAPNPNFAPTSPAIEAARAATAAQFGPGQVPDAAAAARYAPAPALPPGVPPVTSVPGGTDGIVPRPQSLLGPQPGAPPPAMAAAGEGPTGGLLGPQIPEAVAALAQQAALRPRQVAGPGAPDPTAPPVPPPPAVPSLLQGGGARPPIAPVTGPMPGPPTSLLEPPAPPAAAAPPAAPAAPTGAPPPFVLPPLPTTMPALPSGGLTPPSATSQQMIAQGVTGMMALTGRTPPAWMQDLAKMPAQMAMEQYKIYMTNQAAMMSKQYEKQLDIAGAQTIAYLQDQGKLPGDLTRMTEQHNLLLRNALAEKGMSIVNGKYQISPEYLAAAAQAAQQNAAAVAQGQQATALEKIEREQRERGQQARLTARDEATNKPVLIPGVGLVVPGQLPGFNYQSVDSAVPNVAGPGGAPPAPGAQTSSNVLFRTQSEPQKAFLAANIAATEKQLATYHTEQAAAPEQIGTADMIEKLIPQTQFGWGEDTKVQAAMIMKRLGVGDESLKQFMGVNTAAAGDLTKLFLRFSTGAVREMGAREPGSVISLFMRNFPNLESDPDTARTMTNVLRMQAQYQQDRGAAAMRYANEQQRNAGIHGENYTGMNNFLESFDKTNPMKDYTRAAAAMSGYAGIGQQSRDVLKGMAWDGYAKPEDMQRVVALIPQGRTYLAPNGQLYNR